MPSVTLGTTQNVTTTGLAQQTSQTAPSPSTAQTAPMTASNVPQAPTVAAFYEFLGGKAPAAGAGGPPQNNELENLLD